MYGKSLSFAYMLAKGLGLQERDCAIVTFGYEGLCAASLPVRCVRHDRDHL